MDETLNEIQSKTCPRDWISRTYINNHLPAQCLPKGRNANTITN